MHILSTSPYLLGYELGFWSGVYGTVIGQCYYLLLNIILCCVSVGHTHIFPKYYVGAALFFIGLGEIVGKNEGREGEREGEEQEREGEEHEREGEEQKEGGREKKQREGEKTKGGRRKEEWGRRKEQKEGGWERRIE